MLRPRESGNVLSKKQPKRDDDHDDYDDYGFWLQKGKSSES